MMMIILIVYLFMSFLVVDGQCVATVSHDRTIKLWSSRGNGKEKDMDID